MCFIDVDHMPEAVCETFSTTPSYIPWPFVMWSMAAFISAGADLPLRNHVREGLTALASYGGQRGIDIDAAFSHLIHKIRLERPFAIPCL